MPSIDIVRAMMGFLILLRSAVNWMHPIRRSLVSFTRSIVYIVRELEGTQKVLVMHWEHRFNHMVKRYNDIFRIQMPNITPHVCRHIYCSNQAKDGMSPKTLQYLMGHSDIGVTFNTYTHMGMEDAEKELKRMAQLEEAKKEMGIKEMPMKQNMFKVV